MIASLKAVLGLDSMPYKAGARGVKQENRSIQQSFAKIGAAIGVSFGIAAIVRAGRALVDYASQASIAARNVGMLTSEMIALNRVGMTAGMQTRQMEQLMSRMSTELFEAARGSETAEKKFTDMGLSIEDLISMSPADQLRAVAKAAIETGVPIGHLADLFGQRLGPQAMTALRQIANEGLPEVDEAIGRQADQIEALGSAWDSWRDRAKGAMIDVTHRMVTFFDNLAMGMRRTGAFWGAVAAGESMDQAVTSATRMFEGQDLGTRSSQAAQAREESMRREREELVKMREQAVAEGREKEAEAISQRIATTEQAEKAANERMIRQRIEGEDRIRADFLASRQEAVAAWEQAESDALKGIYLERIGLMDRFYHEDVAAHRQAEQDKRQAERDRQQSAIERLQDRLQAEQTRTQGVGVAADALARVGAFMGGERAGLAIEDKSLRVAENTRDLIAEIKQLVKDMETHDAGRTGGGI